MRKSNILNKVAVYSNCSIYKSPNGNYYTEIDGKLYSGNTENEVRNLIDDKQRRSNKHIWLSKYGKYRHNSR